MSHQIVFAGAPLLLQLCTTLTTKRFREHSGNIQGTYREHTGNIQGTIRGHSGNIQETLREHSGNIHCTFTAHSVNIQGILRLTIGSPALQKYVRYLNKNKSKIQSKPSETVTEVEVDHALDAPI